MANLIPWKAERRGFPWLDEDFDNIFEGFFRPLRAWEQAPSGALVPAIDVSEDDEQYLVRAELPGVKKDDINISLEDGVLHISAETKSEQEEKKGGRVIRQERHYGKYVRSLRLVNTVDEQKVKAKYKDGVLELVLPKSESVKPKQIAVEGE